MEGKQIDATMIAYIKDVINPYADGVRDWLGLGKDEAIFDYFITPKIARREQ